MISLGGVGGFLAVSPQPTNTLINQDNHNKIDTAMSETKKCTRCKMIKTLSKFGKSKQTKDGKTCWCLQCKREHNAVHRKTPAGIYQNIKGKQRWRKKHNRDRYKSVLISQGEFIEWYENELKICAYCDIPEDKIQFFSEVYGGRDDRLTVDCKNSTKGYKKGNIVLACDKCNLIKQNVLTYEEMRYVGQNFIKPKWTALVNGSVTE